MSRLSPCPSCQLHVLVGERVCPHCGVSLRTSNARVPALLVGLAGLALTGCPDNIEPVYGSPDSGQPNQESESDTSMETETDTSETETTTVGEPEYGVPDSG